MSGRTCPRAGAALSLVLAITLATGVAPARAGGRRRAPHPAAAASVVATAITPRVDLFDTRDARSANQTLANPTKTDGALVFLVDRIADGGWLQVLLPVRPNGSTGWIHADDVTLAMNPYRILVHLRAHRLVVFKNGRRFLEAPVGVGTSSTPTPGGRYYLTQLFAPPDPDGPYGPHAYSLSGFSEVLQTFHGGDAIIGIHGTNRPDLVGQDVSHGCLRVRNEVIEQLAPVLPLGTPVQIRKR